MIDTRILRTLSDDELLRRLSDLVSQLRRVEAPLVAHISEVDERRLYAREACSSMISYCIEVIHLSEPEAYLRIAVARAARKHPMLLTMLSEGRLHLSGIERLAPHLTEENRDAVLARAAFKSKRQIEELVAELAPKPDVPATIRKLPTPAPSAVRPAEPQPTLVLRPDVLRPDGVGPLTPDASPPAPRPQPLAPERYKVQFTASRELRDKLERLQSLMNQDLTSVIEAAVTEKLERLEAKRYAEVKKPRKKLDDTDTLPKTRYIPAAVKREVRRSDGDRCRFVDRSGRCCTERRKLEFHHHDPFGCGGDHDPTNLSLYCKAHNAYAAKRDLGDEVVARHCKASIGSRETASVYGRVSTLGSYRT